MTRASISLSLCAASTALALSCAATSPGGDDFTIDATISRSVIPVDQTATLTLRLRNLTAYPVRYRFSSSCQLMLFIEQGSTHIAYPPGGSYVCLAVITTLTIPSGGQHLVVQEVRGVAAQVPAPAGIALPPGTYSGYAVLGSNSRTGELRSAPVTFRIE
jgi:hypothetical protein